MFIKLKIIRDGVTYHSLVNHDTIERFYKDKEQLCVEYKEKDEEHDCFWDNLGDSIDDIIKRLTVAGLYIKTE